MELILEIGPADGDLSYALDLVHAAKESGADWVKGQIYHRDLLTTPTASTYAQFGMKVPATQYEDFARQLTFDEWAKVKEECDSTGIGFFASVFDEGAVAFCETLGVGRYKIASGDITHKPLIETVAATGKPTILSTGAAIEGEVAQAVSWSPNAWLMACALSYPCPPEHANIRRMETLRQYSTVVGYSDHTFGVEAIHRARYLGADMVEKHFTLRPGTGGDHDFAVTPAQLAHLDPPTQGDETYDGKPELVVSQPEWRARRGARRSMVARRPIPAGKPLEPEDVVMLRPHIGLEPWQLSDYAGRVLVRDVPPGHHLLSTFFE